MNIYHVTYLPYLINSTEQYSLYSDSINSGHTKLHAYTNKLTNKPKKIYYRRDNESLDNYYKRIFKYKHIKNIYTSLPLNIYVSLSFTTKKNIYTKIK